eukprot:4357914-Pleurochrysis_carterae.AAC.2
MGDGAPGVLRIAQAGDRLPGAACNRQLRRDARQDSVTRLPPQEQDPWPAAHCFRRQVAAITVRVAHHSCEG